MSYNATNYELPIEDNSFFLFKTQNDLFVKNYQDMTFHDILNYYTFLMWVSVTGGLCAYTCKHVYLLFMMMWNVKRGEGEDDDEDTTETTSAEVTEVAFENRYFTEYDDLEEKELTEKFVKDLTLNVIREETPRGGVLMYYSHELESFIYYSKTKEIPYKYLETLARKYVIIYDCKKLYIDIRKEYENGLNKYNEMKENKNQGGVVVGGGGDGGGDKKKKQLFVSFKTYNRKGEVNIKQKDKIYILKEKANRYSYRGKIEEYKEEHNEEDDNGSIENDVAKDKKIDFSEFKKMNRT